MNLAQAELQTKFESFDDLVSKNVGFTMKKYSEKNVSIKELYLNGELIQTMKAFFNKFGIIKIQAITEQGK